MPNPYFQFKQFTVHHDKCAMKVGTDGVLLGAWADVSKAERILDVGSGSGLIALMLVQRSTADIHAIDIDKGAFAQSTENFERSSWATRLNAHHISFHDYAIKSNEVYDLIVSNPPYFKSETIPPKQQRALARHSLELDMEQLLSNSIKLLSANGRLCLILPSEQLDQLKELAKTNGLFLSRLTHVHPKPGKPPKRILVQLEKEESGLNEDVLVIEADARHEYSMEFKELLKDFYLAF